MFRESDNSRQLSFFSTVSQHLSGCSSAKYNAEDSWHNIFYRDFVNRIDERIFAPLFSTGKGAPNQSIRVLIGMMVIKEGKGISDEELYESVCFNLLVRKALGLVNLDDPAPSLSTYYLLRQRLAEYYNENGIDLLKQCIDKITKDQAIAYQVSGRSIRMDSKLIGSNIASYSRYELIHKTLLLFYKTVDPQWFSTLPQASLASLKEFVSEKSSDTVYRKTNEEIAQRLKQLGVLIYQILQIRPFPDVDEYRTLERVFYDQYNLSEQEQIDTKSGKDISAKSVQSPYDTECHYRNKNSKHTRGYSHNLTETCSDENSVDLITDVQTEPATVSDDKYVEVATENSQDVLDTKVYKVHADGAYNSEENQAFSNENNTELVLTGFQGPSPRYKLTYEEDGIKCFDTKENRDLDVKTTKNGTYRISTENKYRYFSDKDIEKQRIRRKIEQTPRKLLNIRNNVEASIYQLAYHLRKDKTKYRGHYKNKIWAVLRSSWVNCVRIQKFIERKVKKDGNFDVCQCILKKIVLVVKVKLLRIAWIFKIHKMSLYVE